MHKISSLLLKQVNYNQTKITAELDKQIEVSNQAGFSSEYVLLLTLEKDGGLCPRCGKPWKKVVVKNYLADFMYHAPDCACFPSCLRCGSSLHREAAINLSTCSTCGFRKVTPAERSLNNYVNGYARNKS